MPEIASLPPSPLAPDRSGLPHRHERGRQGDQDAIPFGQLVSAQNRAAHAAPRANDAPRQTPSPLERPVEKSEKSELPAKARVQGREDTHADPARVRSDRHRSDSEEAPAEPEVVLRDTGSEKPACEMKSPTDQTAGIAAEPTEQSAGVAAEPIELPAGVAAEPVETPAGVSAEPIELPAGVSAQPADVTAGLFTAPAETPVGPMVAPVQNPAVASLADAPAPESEAVIAALGAVGSQNPSPKTVTAPIESSQAEALAPAPSEGLGKLAAKAVETQASGRSSAADTPAKAAAPEMPKANFGDLINEFAHHQGAHHRSGDLVGSLDRALFTLPTGNAGQDALRPTPLQMLPIEIGMQALRGVTKFQIRLDPAELGRVDVQLEFKNDGEVKANLVVDRVETLAMLKRDAHTLQQAFEQAGLRQPPDGLQFSLRGEGQQREGQRQSDEPRRHWSAEDEKLMGEMPPEMALRRVMIPNSSLDLMV